MPTVTVSAQHKRLAALERRFPAPAAVASYDWGPVLARMEPADRADFVEALDHLRAAPPRPDGRPSLGHLSDERLARFLAVMRRARAIRRELGGGMTVGERPRRQPNRGDLPPLARRLEKWR